MADSGESGLTGLAVIYEPSEYTRRRLTQAFNWRTSLIKAGERVSPERTGVVFQWDQYENIAWERVLKGELVCNAYNVRKGLIRKAHLAHFLQKYCEKNPSSPLCASLPQTVVVDIEPNNFDWSLADARDAIEAAETKARAEAHLVGGTPATDLHSSHKASKVAVKGQGRAVKTSFVRPLWIVKPSLMDGAKEVKIIRFFEELQLTVLRQPDVTQWVVQRYLERPLLLNNKFKFHLRVYVLAVGSLKVYVCEDVLCLIARAPYSYSNFKDQFAHITNTCVQAEHPHFVEDEQVKLWEEVRHMLPDAGDRDLTVEVMDKIKLCVAETFKAFKAESQGFMPLPNCFELFGWDFLVDHTGTPVLLEVNAGPDFKNTGPRVGHIITSLLEDTLALALDPLLPPSLQSELKARVQTHTTGRRLTLVYDQPSEWGKPNISFD